MSETFSPSHIRPFRGLFRCPVCGGAEDDPRGRGRRCHGYLSSDERYAHCSREEQAGGLALEPFADTYAHRIDGPCRCGVDHRLHADRVVHQGKANGSRRLVCAYVYEDETGKPVFEVNRWEPKNFTQARIEPDGRRVSGRGCMRGVKLVPYLLKQLIKAIDARDPIYVVEGERDADALSAVDQVATTNPGGAGKWRESYSEFFRDAVDVRIIADRDSAGEEHARQVYASLLAVGAKVTLWHSPVGKDVSDLLAAGRSLEDLEPLEITTDSSEQPQPEIEVQDEHLTDLGNARRLVRQHGDQIRYCHPWREWLIWDGRRWAPDQKRSIVRLAKAAVASIYGEAEHADREDARKAIARWAQQSESSARINAMIDLAASEPGIPIGPEELDADAYALNVLNGTLDLRTGSLRPHRREDLLTKLAPVAFDPQARSMLFERFLERALPDPEARRYCQKVAGYTMLGETGADVVVVIHGPTRTGKGTLQSAVSSAFGEYAATAGLEDFAERRHRGGPQPELVRLRGSRMVSVYETARSLQLSASLIKSLAGSDPITARDMYAKPITFLPQFTLWIATNHRPRVPEDDEAIWERLRELPFVQTIPPEQRDPQVRAVLRDPKVSGPAILAWAVEGCLAYQREGLETPEVVRKATAEFRAEMDPLHDFLAACCVLDPGEWAPAGLLRDSYEKWCHEAGEKPVGGRRWAARLKANGCKPARRHEGRGWVGIRLRRPEDDVHQGQDGAGVADHNTCFDGGESVTP